MISKTYSLGASHVASGMSGTPLLRSDKTENGSSSCAARKPTVRKIRGLQYIINVECIFKEARIVGTVLQQFFYIIKNMSFLSDVNKILW